MAIEVGSLFRWRMDALGIAGGLTGICYAQIDDGLSGVLFENGVPIALSELELNRYARCLGFAHAHAGYRFDGLLQLLDDYDAGMFNGAFRGDSTATAVA